MFRETLGSVAHVLTTGALVLGAVACQEPATVDSRGTWALVEADLPDGHWEDGNGGAYVLSMLADGADGNFECTTYTARVRRDGTDFSFSALETGHFMTCPPEFVDPMEGRYLTALEAIESATRHGRFLVLTGPETRLTFESYRSWSRD